MSFNEISGKSLHSASNCIQQISSLGCFCNDGCRIDMEINLDSQRMRDLFGRAWERNKTKVSIQLIFRGITKLGGIAH